MPPRRSAAMRSQVAPSAVRVASGTAPASAADARAVGVGEHIPLPLVGDDEPNARPAGRDVERARVEPVDEGSQGFG